MLTRHAGTFFSFGIIQASQYLLPLLAFPYLSSRLGGEEFGILLYMVNISMMLGTVMDWGFSFSAVRSVAQRRHDTTELYGILRSVSGAKMLLTLGCAGIGVLAFPLVPYATGHVSAYALALLYGICLGWNPTWFYQGLGSGMRRMAVLDGGAGMLALLLTFMLVDGPGQGWRYLSALFASKSCVYVWQLAKAFNGLGAPSADLPRGWNTLKITGVLFFTRISTMLYREAGVFILGYILAPGQLGVFVVADKIARAFVSLSNPVTQTLFPEICSDRNARPGAAAKYLRWSFTGTAVGMTLLAAGVYALSGRIMPLVLGGMRAEAAGTLKILAAIIPLLSLSTVLGTQTLIPFHRERAMTAVLAGAGVCGIPVLILLAGSMGVYGAAWTVVLVESAVFLSLLGVVARYCPEAFFPRRRLDGGPQ